MKDAYQEQHGLEHSPLVSRESEEAQEKQAPEQTPPETQNGDTPLVAQKSASSHQCESPAVEQALSSVAHDGDTSKVEERSEDKTSDSQNSGESKADLKPEQPSPPQLSSAEKHLMLIQNQLEDAKHPASYETYECHISEADKRIQLFVARRKGESHVRSKTPCQDYCLSTSVNGCTILADADGVGSCEHSDIGSRLACEAVVRAVQEATQSCDGEEELVRRLLTISFRDRLVRFWIEGVLSQIGDNATSSTERLKEFIQYGSTILFAIITENDIVVGNLGDGQVLVFNDHYGVKLRLHAPKCDTSVRCLTNDRCVREDFLVARYPRKFFNGVLLSSDGMYESFDKGNHFFNYAIQMKERFLGRTPPEPYQPFCYKEEGEPFKDFSRMRTQDDCSIALALDERNVASDYEAIRESILQHAQAMLARRWSPDCMTFYTKKDNAFADVVISRGEPESALPNELESAVIETPEETWCDGNLFFAKYAETERPTIEFMHCTGMFRRSRANPEETERRILNVFLQIRKLQKELQVLGLRLNSSAPFNIVYDGKALHIRKEAISRLGDVSQGGGSNGIERCFSHLLGVFESEGKKSSVFDIGYIGSGFKQYRANNPLEVLAQLVRIDGKRSLKNISSYSWKFEDGKILPPGECLELGKTMKFTLLGSQGEVFESYKYVSKELL